MNFAVYTLRLPENAQNTKHIEPASDLRITRHTRSLRKRDIFRKFRTGHGTEIPFFFVDTSNVVARLVFVVAVVYDINYVVLFLHNVIRL